ncbi:prepilin-type N-terminal cleavage/methylation domain-containing protein [Gilvimarinus agarilyticus]|uniref:type IV pilus modification PilV family protein n=1 Tax=Gilvimarinus sp. 2_MG-2023 TaxID=3062666 RepID=UPI001C097BDB|nr:prepilin-type N-terminal cleavage/methylation domain-containing protein [Gilvimarinus sp. 2_MG-2023]MBU2887579.1 prepilin-type N-terminal cleavage/methylation domain-containing protein [Gilvimarinus agarilyticus]MDO6572230.1 prepilin-type N-terminal cleavage/methylation domain-containing protein [Gilvimarinus sp. 2_MG-2023]
MKCVRSTNKGFSLIEVMVAIAILGISLGMIYQAAGGSVRSVSTSEDYAYAVELAQSLLAMNALVPAEGVSTAGVTQDGYHWSVLSAVAAVDDADVPALHSVEVSVRWGSTVRPREFQLHSMVPTWVEKDAR